MTVDEMIAELNKTHQSIISMWIGQGMINWQFNNGLSVTMYVEDHMDFFGNLTKMIADGNQTYNSILVKYYSDYITQEKDKVYKRKLLR